MTPALPDKLGHPFDVVPAHPAPAVVRVVVGDQRRDRLEVLPLHVLEQPVDVPRRVHERDLAGGFRPDDVGEVLHRADLDLLDEEGGVAVAVAHAPGSAALAEDFGGARPHLLRDPARAPRVEVEVHPVLAELGRELPRSRVVHPVQDPHRGAPDVHEPGADEDPVADPELAPEPTLELEGREADAVLAEVGGSHAEPGDDVHVGVGEAVQVEGHAHVPEEVDLPRLDGVAARIDEPRLVPGRRPRLVGRAVPLHQARFDGLAERRGHRHRLAGVEVHV